MVLEKLWLVVSRQWLEKVPVNPQDHLKCLAAFGFIVYLYDAFLFLTVYLLQCFCSDSVYWPSYARPIFMSIQAILCVQALHNL